MRSIHAEPEADMPSMTYTIRRQCGVPVFALLTMTTLPLAAQTTVPVRPIGTPSGEFREPFTLVSGVRELSDGRIIATDLREKTVQLIDLAKGTSKPIGREGAGPAEWGNPSRLYAMPGDTTFMPDFTNDRFFVVKPDGTPGATIRFADLRPLTSADLAGVDGAGRMLLIDEKPAARPNDGTSGEALVLRYDRRTGKVDTVGTLGLPKGEQSAATMLSGGMMRTVTNLPLAARDAAVIVPDGRIAIVRANPYRIEWVGLDGKRLVGPAAVPSHIRVTQEEKEAFTRSQIRPGAILVKGNPAAGAPPAPGGKSGGGPAKISSAEIKAMMNPTMVWPAEKPPFLGTGSVMAAPDGQVWVLRTRAHDDSIPTYDVFDGTGRVVERVALPKRTRLVAFGRGTAYLARTDDDDLLWLQRVRR
jgi:hypothetical protein